MTGLPNFLRKTPAQLLRAYFDELPVPLSAQIPWSAPTDLLVQLLLMAIDALDAPTRGRIMDETERVSAMSDEAGEAALFAAGMTTCQIDGLESGQARALSIFRNNRPTFEQAEQIRYTDERRSGRMWDGFVAPRNLRVARDQKARAALEQAIADGLRTRNVRVDIFDRSRRTAKQRYADVVQATIYWEGLSSGVLHFTPDEQLTTDKLERHSLRPAIQAAITYDRESGSIEVVSERQASREALARAFADHLLGTPFKGERIPLRRYSLDRLCEPFRFATEPEDNIESVEVRLLRLMPLQSQGERITLECMHNSGRTVWDVAFSRLNCQDGRIEGYRVTQARLVVRFRMGIAGTRRGRTLPVTITMPAACDLRDRNERERLIGEKYLSRWGLLETL